jgi:hypothetical protein
MPIDEIGVQRATRSSLRSSSGVSAKQWLLTPFFPPTNDFDRSSTYARHGFPYETTTGKRLAQEMMYDGSGPQITCDRTAG